MDVLVPVDGSPGSARAVEFAVQLAEEYDARLHVVHISDAETEATERILADAEERVVGADADVELVLAEGLDVRPAAGVGAEIARLVEEEGYDHVVMGHDREEDVVERVILGSAASAVLDELWVPTTIVP